MSPRNRRSAGAPVPPCGGDGGLIRISGKTAGDPAAPEFCPLCSWRRERLGFRLPYQRVPGVFSSFDSIQKEVVRRHQEEHGRLPEWLASVGDVVRYVEPPHWSVFNTVIAEHGILLTGVADGIFVLRDGSLAITDYKTARCTPAQDRLLPVYTVQLHAYARIAEDRGMGNVSRLALVFFEPQPVGDLMASCLVDGLGLKLTARVLVIERQPDLLDRMLAKVRELHDLTVPPPGRPGCEDCRRVNALLALHPTCASRSPGDDEAYEIGRAIHRSIQRRISEHLTLGMSDVLDEIRRAAGERADRAVPARSLWLTTRDIAARLGIDEITAARHCRRGLIDADKTAGGQWRTTEDRLRRSKYLRGAAK